MKQKTKIVSKNYMDKVPMRSADMAFKELENGIIEIDVPHKSFYGKIATKFFRKPAVSHITLDEYGSKVWLSINGKNTIFDLVNIMKDSFPDEEDKMLNRVVTFMAILEDNKYILYK